jgi:hypothetical protein
MTHRWTRGIVVCLSSVVAFTEAASADGLGDLVGGLGQLLTGVFAIPVEAIQGTLSGPPILGTIGGILSGAVHTVGSTLGGVLQVAKSIVPIAASLAPFLPWVL